MRCDWPLRAHRLNGGRVRVLGRSDAKRLELSGLELFEVPCNRCIACMLEKSRQWAIRITHEQLVTDQSCFLTLTYAPEHLPPSGLLCQEDWTLFAKRLRDHKGSFRFFNAGEYGETNNRPHFHTALLGHDFADTRLFSKKAKKSKKRLFVDEELNRIWGKGEVQIGELTFDSAAYVARYLTKALPSNRNETRGARVNSSNRFARWKAEGVRRDETAAARPLASMSRRPGLGKPFFDKYWTEIYPRDEVVVNGRAEKPPRYYDQLLEREQPYMWAFVKAQREAAADFTSESSERRLIKARYREGVTATFKRDV